VLQLFNQKYWPFFSIFRKMAFFSCFWQNSYTQVKTYPNKEKRVLLELTKARLNKRLRNHISKNVITVSKIIRVTITVML